MNLRALITSFRADAKDKVEPYFHDDEIVKLWFNEAVQEACIRGRLIREWDNPEVCEIDILSGSSRYQLHESLYEISSIRLHNSNSTSYPLALVTPEYLDRSFAGSDWRSRSGDPRYVVQNDTDIRLVPTPDKDGMIQMEGYRVPLVDMEELDDTPEINKIHHHRLVDWVLYKAFSVPDEEFLDPEKAAQAYARFEDYFGIRPDSDLRRETRHDIPQVVQAFIP